MKGKVSGIGKFHVIITLFISLSIAWFLIQAREFRVTGSTVYVPASEVGSAVLCLVKEKEDTKQLCIKETVLQFLR